MAINVEVARHFLPEGTDVMRIELTLPNQKMVAQGPEIKHLSSPETPLLHVSSRRNKACVGGNQYCKDGVTVTVVIGKRGWVSVKPRLAHGQAVFMNHATVLISLKMIWIILDGHQDTLKLLPPDAKEKLNLDVTVIFFGPACDYCRSTQVGEILQNWPSARDYQEEKKADETKDLFNFGNISVQ